MGKFLLGVAEKDITPKVGGRLYGYHDGVFSTSIHDKLTATAFLFEKDGKRVMLVSLTVCLVKTSLADELRAKIKELCRVDAVMLAATHTHSAPNVVGTYGWGDPDWDYYNEIFAPQVVAAAVAAAEHPIPVTMGVAYGESHVGMNRRELRKDNTIALGQNPWGCYDPRMTVISFRGEDGKTVANMVCYGCHGTAAGTNHEVSRDWSGVMVDRLAELSGGITAFFNGPEGDVGPRLTNGKTVGGGNIRYAEELGGIAAQDAMRIFKQIYTFTEPDLAFTEGNLKLALSPRPTKEEAQAGYDKYKGNTDNIQAQTCRFYENVLKSYEEGYEEKEYLEVPQTVVRVGGLVFLGFPYEAFSEIGMRIRLYSGFEHVFSLSNTNGSEGYFPTETELCRGGYEIGMFKTARVQPCAPFADDALIAETLKNMEGIK